MVELVWDGKYDAQGKRVAPPRLRLPFQTVETVNESAQQRQLALDLFSSGRPAEWRNRLIWGDKKYVLPALLDEFAGKVDLIYIDPPFNVGADFSLQMKIEGETFTKEPSVIEQKAYRDTWGRGLDGYLQWFAETAASLYELLKVNGSLYVHLDWHVIHYAKVILDEVFGYDMYRNEIIWKRSTPRGNAGKRYAEATDHILFYTKGEVGTWHDIYGDYREEYVEKYYSYTDEHGRRFQPTSLLGHQGVNPVVTWRGISKPWRYPPHRLDELDEQGLIYWPERGEMPRLKRYLEEQKGQPLQSLWEDIPPVNSQAKERLDYPTQKPEALLERVMGASSNEGDLVLDCFAGSGTTAAVAEKLGRRWITCDLGRFAIHTTRKRLLSIDNVRPFVVQNLGKYERQAWQVAEFGNAERAAALTASYRNFILDLYRAEPLPGYTWLHGRKAGRMVHVGAVDAPIAPSDISQIAIEFRKLMGTGKDAPSVNAVDVLGWDFAFDLNEVARQKAAEANLALRFVRIPREVLEKRAVEQGDIRFFELAALAVEMQRSGRSVTLQLTDFVIPPDDVPADIQAAITHWSQWIDYWAVDWDNQGDTFHNMWQTYRTRQEKSLAPQAAHTYTEPGNYTILIKVIDILGNDTTRALRVEIAGLGHDISNVGQ